MGNARASNSGTSDEHRFPAFFFLYGLIIYYFEPSGSGVCWNHFFEMSIKSCFEIIDYTEKSIVVFGDTKSIKDNLKALGGRFNSRLNYNGERAAGWIFPKGLRSQIEELLEISDDKTDTEISVEIDKNEEHHNSSNVGDLPKCIKLLCKIQGKDYIFEDMFVNALSDYNAFSTPLHKNILKNLVREGYLNIFESKDKWNRTYQQTINNISYNFGWSESIIRYIFDSIAYGINYLRKKTTYNDVYCSNEVALLDNNAIKFKTAKKHLTFKGIEINGNPNDIRTQLECKGFSFISKDGNYIFLEGDFAANENCGIMVLSNLNINLVWGIQVNLPEQHVWNNLIGEYMYYVSSG